MKLFIIHLLFLLLMSSSFKLNAEQPLWHADGPHIKVALLSEHDALVPGQSHLLAIRMSPDQQWHTYWRNPGDSGEAPKADMSANAALTFGEFSWPVPEAIPVAHLKNYGYSNEHLLVFPVTVPTDLVIGTEVKITAELSWLVCKEDCIPGWATLSRSLPVKNAANPTEFSEQFTTTINALPEFRSLDAVLEINQDNLALQFSGQDSGKWKAFPFRSDLIDHAAMQTSVVKDGLVSILLNRSAYFTGDAQTASFLVSSDTESFYLKATTLTAPGSMPQTTSWHLLTILLFAFLGGLILNIMPCVLPILSIKALALQEKTTSLSKNLAYFLGVLTCFNAFAIAILVLQQSGNQMGWGFHMQSPVVIWILAFLFTFIALTLLDVFSVGSRIAGIGNELITGSNARSHFFTGLLAVVVASPCTAPFMAAALGVALISEPVVTIIIFNALAIGFALPLTLVFMSKSVHKLIPKPGAWMVTFKQFLAFPMFATTAWLVWVYAGQQGIFAQFILLISLVIFCFCGWASTKTSSILRYSLTVGMLLCLFIPAFFNLPKESAYSATADSSSNGYSYDPSTLEMLKKDQQVVLVNMTADWCITCKVNEQVALNTAQVQSALQDSQIHYMVGDWTRKDNQILDYLKQYERVGVPLYVVYAGTKSATVLPQVLTTNIVVDALTQAKEEIEYVN